MQGLSIFALWAKTSFSFSTSKGSQGSQACNCNRKLFGQEIKSLQTTVPMSMGFQQSWTFLLSFTGTWSKARTGKFPSWVNTGRFNTEIFLAFLGGTCSTRTVLQWTSSLLIAQKSLDLMSYLENWGVSFWGRRLVYRGYNAPFQLDNCISSH